MKSKLLTLLGFASKAGKLSFGFDMCVTALKRNKSEVLLCAEDLSPKTKKEIDFHSTKFGVQTFTLENINIETLSHCVGRKCGIISVNDTGFAKALKEEILND